MLRPSPSPWVRGRLKRPSSRLSRFEQRMAGCTVRASSAETSASWDAPPVVIVGAGIAGLATAVAMQKVGIPVKVLEAAGGLRDDLAAIGLWDNAWKAMDILGVADKLRSEYLNLSRVELCRGESGKVLKAFTFNDSEVGTGQEFRGVHRGALLKALASELSPETITYNSSVSGITKVPGQQGSECLELQLADSSLPPLRCSMLIGSDGVRSVVAKHLGLAPVNYAGYIAYRGVMEGSPESVGLPDNTIRQIWGSGVRAGLYPLNDNSVYWFVCVNAAPDAPIPESPEQLAADANSYIKDWPWKVDEIIRKTPAASINRSRLGDRWTPPGAFGSGLITLAGDAAHPMTPNLGQGGCTALEDAVVLAAEVASVLKTRQLAATRNSEAGPHSTPSLSTDLEQALRRYEAGQSKRTLYLTVRANLMGAALQIDNPLVCAVRDTFVANFFDSSHFLDHTEVSLPQLESRPAL